MKKCQHISPCFSLTCAHIPCKTHGSKAFRVRRGKLCSHLFLTKSRNCSTQFSKSQVLTRDTCIFSNAQSSLWQLQVQYLHFFCLPMAIPSRKYQQLPTRCTSFHGSSCGVSPPCALHSGISLCSKMLKSRSLRQANRMGRKHQQKRVTEMRT